jgi:hypothetical protein
VGTVLPFLSKTFESNISTFLLFCCCDKGKMDSLAVALCKPCLSIDMVKLCHICLQRSVDEGF